MLNERRVGSKWQHPQSNTGKAPQLPISSSLERPSHTCRQAQKYQRPFGKKRASTYIRSYLAGAAVGRRPLDPWVMTQDLLQATKICHPAATGLAPLHKTPAAACTQPPSSNMCWQLFSQHALALCSIHCPTTILIRGRVLPGTNQDVLPCIPISTPQQQQKGTDPFRSEETPQHSSSVVVGNSWTKATARQATTQQLVGKGCTLGAQQGTMHTPPCLQHPPSPHLADMHCTTPSTLNCTVSRTAHNAATTLCLAATARHEIPGCDACSTSRTGNRPQKKQPGANNPRACKYLENTRAFALVTGHPMLLAQQNTGCFCPTNLPPCRPSGPDRTAEAMCVYTNPQTETDPGTERHGAAHTYVLHKNLPRPLIGTCVRTRTASKTHSFSSSSRPSHIPWATACHLPSNRRWVEVSLTLQWLPHTSSYHNAVHMQETTEGRPV